MTTPEDQFEFRPLEIDLGPSVRVNAQAQGVTQQARNRKLEKNPNAVYLPGGIVAVVDYVQPSYTHKQNWWLAEPHLLLKDPKPPESGYVYAWPRLKEKDGKNNPTTAGLVRGGRFRKVTKKELIANLASDVQTHAGEGVKTEDGYVFWGDLILVEVHPSLTKSQYIDKERQALYRIKGYRDELEADIEQLSGGQANLTEFKVEPARNT